MEEKGIVTKANKLRATVQLKRHSFCGECNVCKKNDDGTTTLEIANSKNAEVGDKVIISVKNRPSKVLILMILLPLVVSLLIGVGAYFLLNGWVAAVVFGAIGLGGSVYFVMHLKNIVGLRRKTASMKQIYEKGESNGSVNK